MRSSEINALGKLAGQAFADPARIAKGVHGALAQRTFGALGVLGAPTRVLHDGISGLVYRSVAAGLGAPLRGGAAALSRGVPPDAPRLADSPAGSIVLSALNGMFGDRLAREHGDLALDLTVRRHDRDVATDRAGLATAFPDATSKLVVFVHGLCGDEHGWHLPPLARHAGPRRCYGSRLRAELGYTPLYVRYNTGLHVSENGKRLARVLDQVVREWPVEVDELALVGHSMGGLVSRSACHYARAADQPWADRVRHVFCLGTPHMGAPLEKAANVTGWALARLPETRPFAAIVNRRSAGIKDLRFGNCVEEDWCDCDPDEFLRDRCGEVPFLPTATYYFIGATLTKAPNSSLARVVGDLLVLYPSASGQGRKRRIPFEVDNGVHLGGASHLQLLNHPAVYDQIETWLRRAGRSRDDLLAYA